DAADARGALAAAHPAAGGAVADDADERAAALEQVRVPGERGDGAVVHRPLVGGDDDGRPPGGRRPRLGGGGGPSGLWLQGRDVLNAELLLRLGDHVIDVRHGRPLPSARRRPGGGTAAGAGPAPARPGREACGAARWSARPTTRAALVEGDAAGFWV